MAFNNPFTKIRPYLYFIHTQVIVFGNVFANSWYIYFHMWTHSVFIEHWGRSQTRIIATQSGSKFMEGAADSSNFWVKSRKGKGSTNNLQWVRDTKRIVEGVRSVNGVVWLVYSVKNTGKYSFTMFVVRLLRLLWLTL